MADAFPLPAARGETTRATLKRVARRLFAERGIAAVGTREIAEAAGQRNAAAVHYHFGGKDGLLRELVADGAAVIDAERRALLDAAEAAAGGATLERVVAALVLPGLELRHQIEAGETYLRFIGNLQSERRALFDEVVRAGRADAYQDCLAHVRRLLAPLPAKLVNQRLLFAGLSLQAILMAREAALDGAPAAEHRYWDEAALAELKRSITAILLAPAA